MVTNLYLFFLVLAKAALLTGFLPWLGLAIFFEKFRVLEMGVEKVSEQSSGDGQLARLTDLIPAASSRGATSPSRKVRVA